jgi:hypothetical protein
LIEKKNPALPIGLEFEGLYGALRRSLENEREIF